MNYKLWMMGDGSPTRHPVRQLTDRDLCENAILKTLNDGR